MICHALGNSSDAYCLSKEGGCFSSMETVRVLYDKNNVGVSRLAEWEEEHISLPKECSCKIFNYSLFAGYV